MTPRLPPVLSPLDLPMAELQAARLDGELFRVDSCFAVIDEIEQPRHRAAALHAGLSDRLIAEQLSAAWIWGAIDFPPAPHTLCAAVGARVGHAHPPWMTVREVVIDPLEITTIDGYFVTTPLRTAVDLARFAADFDPGILNRLGVDPLDCRAEIERRKNLPGKRRALQRLALP